VQGFIITNSEGKIIKTTYTGEKKVEGDKILAHIPNLVYKTQISVRNINQSNDLQFLRLKTKTNEILIAPDKNNEFIFIVIQGLMDKNEGV
jgi:dynein light chain roadblock-type